MRRNIFTPIALFATLALPSFSLVWAGHDFRPRDLERLAVQAHRLERAAWHLERDAAHLGYDRGFPRVVALNELREFRRATRRFHHAVEDRFVRMPSLERRYRELVFAFEDAEWAMHRLRGRRLGLQFREVDRQMRRVVRGYRDVMGISIHNTRRRAYRDDDFERRDRHDRHDEDADRHRRRNRRG